MPIVPAHGIGDSRAPSRSRTVRSRSRGRGRATISGAIFTTDITGVPVNLNIYAAKQDVYLNGGPGINAPDDAAGLPAGTYSFR